MNALLTYVAATAGLALAASGAEAGLLLYSRTAGPGSPYPDPQVDEYPTLSVIIPAYREGERVMDALDSAAGLDYPRDRLEVLLALEPDDDVTPRALGRLAGCTEAPCERGGIRVLVVRNSSGIRSKPAALREAARAARGDIICVLDAEDVLDRDAAKAAVGAIAGDVAAVQLARDARNPRERGPITIAQHGELEANNNYFIPALRRLTGFVPILGSGYFVRRSALEEVGMWDPRAPAEDLDLTVKLYERGYRVEFLGSPRVHTLAVTSLRGLIRQRERWIRGTLLVMPRAMKVLGRAWPVVLSYMVSPIAWMLADAWPLIWFVDPAAQALIAGASAASLAVYALKLRMQGGAPSAPLMSIVYAMAAWLAVAKLMVAPRSWSRTRG
ncbi:MAG: glycosyltransferase family 2 protein [Nitrososphaeria archaeon]